MVKQGQIIGKELITGKKKDKTYLRCKKILYVFGITGKFLKAKG